MTDTDTTDDERIIDQLRATFPTSDLDDGERLHARLAERADAEQLLDVAYRTVDSPFGPMLLAATPEGLVRVAFEREGLDTVLTRLADEISPRILAAPRRLDGAARQLDEYFTGELRTFDLALDMQLAHGFRRSVLEHL
ncbi:MAG: methylated-DNA--[protein]-cysteine S-methyltransferase, partial [Ilumatobacteraceae bacterium]